MLWLHRRMIYQRLQGTWRESRPRRLARTFIVLKLPPSSATTSRRGTHDRAGVRPSARRTGSEDNVKSRLQGTTPPRIRTSSIGSAHSPTLRPKLSPSPLSSPQLKPTTRVRTSSSPGSSPLNSPTRSLAPTHPSGPDQALKRRTFGRPPIPRSMSSRGTSPSGSRTQDVQSTVNTPSLHNTEPHSTTGFPFYISPIHRPSVYPRFTSLSREDDFASWLSIREAASETFDPRDMVRRYGHWSTEVGQGRKGLIADRPAQITEAVTISSLCVRYSRIDFLIRPRVSILSADGWCSNTLVVRWIP